MTEKMIKQMSSLMKLNSLAAVVAGGKLHSKFSSELQFSPLLLQSIQTAKSKGFRLQLLNVSSFCYCRLSLSISVSKLPPTHSLCLFLSPARSDIAEHHTLFSRLSPADEKRGAQVEAATAHAHWGFRLLFTRGGLMSNAESHAASLCFSPRRDAPRRLILPYASLVTSSGAVFNSIRPLSA